MKRSWRGIISIIMGSMVGFAFYQIAGNLACAVRDVIHLPMDNPLLWTAAILTLPVTAVVTLATNHVLRRAFRSR